MLISDIYNENEVKYEEDKSDCEGDTLWIQENWGRISSYEHLQNFTKYLIYIRKTWCISFVG